MTFEGRESETIENAFVLGGHDTREEARIIQRATKDGVKRIQMNKAIRKIQVRFLLLVGGIVLGLVSPLFFYRAISYGRCTIIWRTLKLLISLAEINERTRTFSSHGRLSLEDLR